MADHHHHPEHHHPHHHPPHPPPSAARQDVAAANKAHFDGQAHSPPDARALQMAKRAAQAIRAHYAFDEDATVLMDFACNIGLTSRELAPYAKTIVGVDISQAAVDVFNAAVADQGIAPEEMRAVCAELKGAEGELDGLTFDVITCVLAYHHFADIDETTRVLSGFMKPGGALLVVDVVKPARHGAAPLFAEEHHHVVPHSHGMTREGMQAAMEGAGLVDFVFKPLTTVIMHGTEAVLFLAKAANAAA
ncbi:S-adenosyl-L-methionine-dependent methyltransferase [Pholiota molesta]|nr:S-adenosyl-L-methionine-dependent methyltransferase [Pholiota molesta]